MSNGATKSAPMYRVVRELGARAVRSYAAIREPHELVVLQRFVKSGADAGEAALPESGWNQVLRDAECLAKNWHPNIARIRHVDVDDAGATIASEMVEGMTLGDLFAASWTVPLLPYAVIVRILVDVLGGLNALHGMRDGTRALGSIHGAMCPVNVVVGKDGVARLVNCVRSRPVLGEAGSESLHYAAPESLDEGGTKDVRSDVYSVGVILWEALVGIVPYEASDPVQLLARQRAEEVVNPAIDPGSPFAALGAIAMRAIAFEPSLRYRTAAEMATALRKLAGTEIAAGSVVASTVAEIAADRIRARRAELDPMLATRRTRNSKTSRRTDPTSPLPTEVSAFPDRITIAPAPDPTGSTLGAPPRPADLPPPPPRGPAAVPPVADKAPVRPPPPKPAARTSPLLASAPPLPSAPERPSVMQRASVVERASVVQRAAVVERSSVVQRAAAISATTHASASSGAVVNRASVLQRAAVVDRASVLQRTAVVERESATMAASPATRVAPPPGTPVPEAQQPPPPRTAAAERALDEAAIAASEQVMAPVAATPLAPEHALAPPNIATPVATESPPRRTRARIGVLLVLAAALLLGLVAGIRALTSHPTEDRPPSPKVPTTSAVALTATPIPLLAPETAPPPASAEPLEPTPPATDAVPATNAARPTDTARPAPLPEAAPSAAKPKPYEPLGI